MSLYLDLSPEMESYISGKVASGLFDNAADVIREAVRRMQVDEERVAAFLRAVAEGEAQLDLGQGREYTAERLNELADIARKNLRGDKSKDPDVPA